MRSSSSAIRSQWREGKVRPLPGNSPDDRPVSRGISFTFWRICDDPFGSVSRIMHRNTSILARCATVPVVMYSCG